METLIFHFMYIIHDLQWIHIILWRTDLYVLNVNLYWKWLSTSGWIAQYMSYARPWQCSNKNYFWSFGKRHWNWKYVFRHKLFRHEQFYLLFYRSDSFKFGSNVHFLLTKYRYYTNGCTCRIQQLHGTFVGCMLLPWRVIRNSYNQIRYLNQL